MTDVFVEIQEATPALVELVDPGQTVGVELVTGIPGPRGASLGISVTDYGATGDGITDDTPAVQAAIDAADGHIVFFPPGVYLAAGLTATPGVMLHSSGASIMRNADTDILTITAGAVTVDGLTFDANAANWPASNNASVLVTAGGDGATIRNCRFVNGVAHGHDVRAIASDAAIAGIRIVDNVFGPDTTNVYLEQDCTEFLIAANDLDCEAGSGIGVNSSVAAKTIQRGRILGNRIRIGGDGSEGVAIGVANLGGVGNPAEDVVIADNTILIDDECFAAMSLVDSVRLVVHGNTITCAPGVRVPYCVEWGVRHSTFSANTIEGSGALGLTLMFMNNASDSRVVGNLFRNPGASSDDRCVVIGATSPDVHLDRNILSGNHFEVPEGSGAYVLRLDAHGELGATINDTVISSNHFLGNSASRGVHVEADEDGAVDGTLIEGNTWRGGAFALRLLGDTNTSLIGNKVLDVTDRYFTDPGDVGGIGIMIESNDWQRATAPPATGRSYAGEKIWNSSPAEGDPIGWICTVAGTPGTWAAMAELVAL